MKNFLLVLFLISLTNIIQAKVLIGQVNVQQVLLKVKQGVKVQNELKSFFEKKNIEIKKEEDAIRKSQEDFQKQSAVMNDIAKNKKREEIQKKMFELQEKTANYQKEINELEQQKKGPILKQLKEVIEKVSADNQVDMTVEISTTPLLYAKESLELTEKVIQAYDEKYPK